MKKYELTDETKEFDGKTLHRIKALIDLSSLAVKAGDLGGWIEKEENLSQEGQCWVADNACVFDNTHICDNAWISGNARVFGNVRVSGNAQVDNATYVHGDACVFGDACISGNVHVFGSVWIFDNAHVFGNACISDNARIHGNAKVFGNAHVFNYARVFGNTKVFDNAWVYNDAHVRDNAKVFDKARVHGDARVYGSACVYGSAYISGNACVSGNAQVYDNACVSGDAKVYGDAIICERMFVSYSRIDTDLQTDVAASLRGQCNLLLIRNKVIAYKIVNKNLTSLYDKNFTYKVGEIAEVENPDESNESCASGLHFSNLTYWDNNVQEYKDKIYLVAEIDVEDIITIQQGKIRCKKAKILDKIDIK